MLLASKAETLRAPVSWLDATTRLVSELSFAQDAGSDPAAHMLNNYTVTQRMFTKADVFCDLRTSKAVSPKV